MTPRRIAVFDFDGTLLDTDAALAAPFAALGVDPDEVPLGLPLPEACALVDIDVDDYLAAYDPALSTPFPGVEPLLQQLGQWAICSNRHPESGPQELARLGWEPNASWFNPGDGPKTLRPLLDELQVTPEDIVFVGDTDHDRSCAAAVGCRFAFAGWNSRAVPATGDVVLERPDDLVEMLS